MICSFSRFWIWAWSPLLFYKKYDGKHFVRWAFGSFPARPLVFFVMSLWPYKVQFWSKLVLLLGAFTVVIAALVSDQLLYLNLTKLEDIRQLFMHKHVYACYALLICWLIDILGFLLYDYLIFSLYLCSFHARLPACLKYVKAFSTVYSYLNSGYGQFSVANPAGLIIDTRNWLTVFRNNALFFQERRRTKRPS